MAARNMFIEIYEYLYKFMTFARNMFIEIYEYLYKFMTFARMLGRPHGGAPTGLCRNSQKINSFKNRDK